MPIQMVCDSTPSLVSAAIRDALHSTGGTTNGRTVGHGYGAASTSNGVTVNGTGTASGQSPSKQQLSFRRTLAAAQLDNDYDQYDEPEDGGPNDLVESISQSLRQGQQVKPLTYEEGPSYSTNLENLRSKYIVLKAGTLADSTASGGSLSNSNSSSSFGAAGLTKATTGGSPNTLLTMNGGSLKFSASSTPSPSAAKSSNHVLHQQQNGVPASASSTAAGRMDTTNTNTLPTPKRTLFPRENVQIGWKTTGRKWLVGAGMMNMGNTCYLNSTLQALFHVPAIANWLLSDEPHRVKCDEGGSGGNCIICAMAKTLLESQSNQTAFRPYLVYSRLRLVCKHLVPGRQEDAHEFLRYLVEAMEKSYLNRSKNSKELDQYSKETTPLNQILGGYLRSEVKCLSCQHVSTTFQHFEDLLLDIRKANSIDEALEVYFARERLEEMGYKCEACKRRVAATKQFSLERAPFVLCIQLKRFSMLSGKINKHVELRSKLDLTPYSSPAMRTNGGKLTYRLTSMVTHLGSTQHCGHYTAIGHTDAAGYHVFDDSSVRPIGIHNVMSTNAYILFYELESVAAGAIGLPNGTCRAKATVTVGQPSSTATLTSMGHLSNGTSPTTGLGSSGGTASGTSGTGGGGSNGGTPGKITNSSPLRVLGTGGGNGSSGGLFPSKLEQKPGLIGPVLPTATTSTTGSNPSATATTTAITGKGANNNNNGPTTTTSVTSSASASGRDIAIFSSPSSTASTLSNASPLSSPAKQYTESLSGSKVPKLPDINARNTTASLNGAAYSEAKVKCLSTPLLASMPKLNSPCKSSESTNGCSSAVISLVPYDSDDTSSTSEDEDNHELGKTTPKSLVLTNGSSTAKRARQQLVTFVNGKRSSKHSKDEPQAVARDEGGNGEEEEEDEEEEEERTSTGSSRSPQMIKTKAGLWKVSKSSTADQLSYPDSGSASSSKSSSPTTSGVSSPTSSPGQKPHKLPLKNVGTSGGDGGESSSLSNGHRPAHNGMNGKINKAMANGYHTNGAAGNRSASPGGDGKGSSSTVQMLMKYSHRGYGAPVKSWNGQQTAMERELTNERREERKRQIEEDRETEMDRGRIKKTKASGGAQSSVGVANSGGNNPFQQYQNHQTGGGGKWMGNGGGNRNHFHNHHQNNYRGGGGGGGGYYQNGNGNRHHGGGGANGGFRTGSRRFGGRNGGGFHTKAHHHHQRSEQGSGMAGGGGGSNGFYHR
ncbi:ubiquitin carboxyl-terminal hydrolase 36 [Anopheles marshallii]|uniref:ubiquitin carboxyl-terminal hydrolase 36 n=1 Tax=Anopheles marshallii TaxID=1521116 RepID=UPI00237A417F|nr:ubiquitin carboxyl-terminal hydrolase 36 [Anopheles marshallii]